MNEASIIAAIESIVSTYSVWYIGVTDNPSERKQGHKNNNEDVSNWKQWLADTENIARDVEKYFLARGMKGDTGGGKDPHYVYIY